MLTEPAGNLRCLGCDAVIAQKSGTTLVLPMFAT
jgi:hypothetical protein